MVRLAEEFKKLFCNHFNILRTPLVALCLLLLENLVEDEFKCPIDHWIVIWYSLIFIIVPFFVLLVFGCKFYCNFSLIRTCRQNLFPLMQILTAPVLWIFVVLSDGRYVGCLITYICGTQNSMYIKTIFRMVGLLGICVIIIVSICFPNSPCCKKCNTMWQRINYENYLMNEVEKHLRTNANSKLKSFVTKLAEKICSADIPQSNDLDWMEKLEENVFDAKRRTIDEFIQIINETSPTNQQATEPVQGMPMQNRAEGGPGDQMIRAGEI